jgi:hypothetical protein
MGFSFRSTGCVKRTTAQTDQRMLERKPHRQRVAARRKDERKTRRVETVGFVNALTVCVTRSAIDQDGS